MNINECIRTKVEPGMLHAVEQELQVYNFSPEQVLSLIIAVDWDTAKRYISFFKELKYAKDDWKISDNYENKDIHNIEYIKNLFSDNEDACECLNTQFFNLLDSWVSDYASLQTKERVIRTDILQFSISNPKAVLWFLFNTNKCEQLENLYLLLHGRKFISMLESK